MSRPPRILGGLGAFAVVAGSMLGIGIFLAPPIVAQHVESPITFVLVWIFAGVTALAGAVAYAELGTIYPRCGGDYVFQSEAFGPSVAFANGWMLLAAVFGGSIAAIAVGLNTYQLPVILGVDLASPLLSLGGWVVTPAQVLALGLVLVLTLVNHLGIRPSGALQAIATLVPLTILLIGAAYVIGAPGVEDSGGVAEPLADGLTTTGLVVAYLPVYFAYSGWNAVIYLAGEVREAGRNIPRSLIGGTLVVTVLYVLLCLGFIKVLGVAGLRAAGEAGSAAARAMAGSAAETALAVFIAIALIATLNGSILGGSRVAYAMAKGGAFWSGAARLHPVRGVPARALWLQTLWAAALILTGSFEQILALASVAMIVSGTITVTALFQLRIRNPQQARPFSAWGYPWLPAFYLLSNIVVIVVMLARVVSAEADALYPLIGLAVLVVMYVSHRLRPGRQSR